ncbi:hypothetical protein F4780DRAFT_761347 [Xylariomycetidae sp. FL0641]|nr:hypothetical protein F4780DRAFT_761347 [Xylariomycetidae sp. FL0641]
MSIRIALDKPPEFYTNLDFVSGRVLLSLNRPENIGNVIVKLEGESRTALALPTRDRDDFGTMGGNIVTENHKILYKVFRVYPDDGASMPFGPGQHEFKFHFKVPLNNICHDPRAMSALGLGGMAGMGLGFRTMDGTKQLMLQHVKATLPPSLTGFPQEAEIRYYIKVTIQRPGLFKENWRYQVGFKFLPIEPPRPAKTKQEAFARRPFTFNPRAPAPSRRSIFGTRSVNHDADAAAETPPSIEIAARIPHPTIITCNEPLPLRLIAKKLVASSAPVFLTGLEIALVGYTQVRVQSLQHTERTTWVVASIPKVCVPLAFASEDANAEYEIPGANLWAQRLLPNTVAPSFRTCNLARRYEIEIKVALTWGDPSKTSGKDPAPPTIHLPLKLSAVDVYSGIKPPPELVASAASASSSSNNNTATAANRPPMPPPRPAPGASRPPQDPLYPPQLGPGDVPGYDDAPPPSYDEAMADALVGPNPQDRPAYSGVTNENAPSSMPPEKSGLH